MTTLTSKVYITGKMFYLFYTDEKIGGLYDNMQVKYIKTEDGDFIPAIRTNIADIEDLTDSHKFGLLHECGHLIHNHISTKRVSKVRGLLHSLKINVIGRNVEPEIEADRHAIKYLGKEKCISILSERLTEDRNISKKEIRKRINAIKESNFVIPELAIIMFFK